MSFTIHCHRGAGHNPKQGIKWPAICGWNTYCRD
jgi:hypothetical protein